MLNWHKINVLPAWRPIKSLPGLRHLSRYHKLYRHNHLTAVRQLYDFHPLLSLSYFNNNILCDKEKKWLYVAIAKNACTSIKAALREDQGDDNLVRLIQQGHPSAHDKTHQIANGVMLALHEIGGDGLQQSYLDNSNCVKFCFVRNPYIRLISAWANKIDMPHPGDSQQGTKPVAAMHRERGRMLQRLFPPGFRQPPISFIRFIRQICRQPALYHDPHWMPQSDALFLDKIRYDFIGRVERLDEDWKKLMAKLGRPLPPLRRLNASAKTPPATDLFTPALRDMVYEKYRSDFEAFGYPHALPAPR